MNRFTGVGRLARNAVLNGSEKKALKFTLATNYGRNAKTGKDRVAFVPCVCFGASEDIVSLLTQEGKGVLVSVEGRVVNSKFESKGETKYSTEVVVEKTSLKCLAKPAHGGPELEEHLLTGDQPADAAGTGEGAGE